MSETDTVEARTVLATKIGIDKLEPTNVLTANELIVAIFTCVMNTDNDDVVIPDTNNVDAYISDAYISFAIIVDALTELVSTINERTDTVLIELTFNVFTDVCVTYSSSVVTVLATIVLKIATSPRIEDVVIS